MDHEYDELRLVLRAHFERYPLMEIRDAVKIIYQHEFACAHILGDTQTAYDYLLKEYSGLCQRDIPLLTDIGGGLCRIDLRALEANGVTPADVFDWMNKTAESNRGDMCRFAAALELLHEEGEPYSFGAERVDSFLADYRRAGYPPIHHSAAYREAYSPAYRVICAGYVHTGEII